MNSHKTQNGRLVRNILQIDLDTKEIVVSEFGLQRRLKWHVNVLCHYGLKLQTNTIARAQQGQVLKHWELIRKGVIKSWKMFVCFKCYIFILSSSPVVLLVFNFLKMFMYLCSIIKCYNDIPQPRFCRVYFSSFQ